MKSDLPCMVLTFSAQFFVSLYGFGSSCVVFRRPVQIFYQFAWFFASLCAFCQSCAAGP